MKINLVTYSDSAICVNCNQEFRLIEGKKRKYCNPACSKEFAKKKSDRENKLYEWECKSCGSLVRGVKAAKARVYCTSRCFEKFSSDKTFRVYQKYIRHPVQVLKESERLKA